MFTLNDQSTTLQVGNMLLVIAYATFGHSRPSGHLVCRDVAYKDWTRRRFFSGNSLRGGSKMHVSGTYLDTTQSFDWILFASWRLQREQVLNILSFAKRNAASGPNGILYTSSWCKHVYRYLILSRTAIVREGNIRKTMAARGLVNGRGPRSGRDLVFRCYPPELLLPPPKKNRSWPFDVTPKSWTV